MRMCVCVCVCVCVHMYMPKMILFHSRPDTLDPALLRPGRMDRKVEFSLPDLEVCEGVRVGGCEDGRAGGCESVCVRVCECEDVRV